MLRVAAAIRDELGREPLGRLVTAYGHSYWDLPQGSGMGTRLSTHDHVTEVLDAAGVPRRFADALDDESWDQLLDAESELALSRTGRDVGTPIITFQPPDGLSFFGPVISRVPSDDEAVELWDAVTTLAKFPGFAELKRSLRERPQLNILGGVSHDPCAGGLAGWPPSRPPRGRPRRLTPATHQPTQVARHDDRPRSIARRSGPAIIVCIPSRTLPQICVIARDRAR